MAKKKIFLSYRREDRPGYVARLKDDLERSFGEGRVFRDVEDIAGGSKWQEVIEQNLRSAGVLLLVIGPRWESIWGARESDPVNYVAFELQRARELGVPVIPITLDGTRLSSEIDLGDIAWLMDNQIYDISDRQGRWSSDVRGLVRLLEGIEAIGKSRSDPVGVIPPVVSVRRRAGWILGLAAAGLLILGLLMLLESDDQPGSPGEWAKDVVSESVITVTTPPSVRREQTTSEGAFLYPDITGVWQSQTDNTIYHVKQHDDGSFDIESPGYTSGTGRFFDNMPRKFEVRMDGVGRGEFSLSNTGQTISGWMLEHASSRQIYDTLVRLR